MEDTVNILVKRLFHAEDLPLPCFMSSKASGADLYAAVDEPVAIEPGRSKLIPTGISLALPPGYEGQVRPRSGLALKHGITVLNTPGTVDADYRGEIKVILINLGEEEYIVRRGERIAQLVINFLPRVQFKEVEELPTTDRGDGGFGHSGNF